MVEVEREDLPEGGKRKTGEAREPVAEEEGLGKNIEVICGGRSENILF